MVKTVLSSWTVAIASADDSAGLVQLSTGVQHSQGQRILAAVAKEGSTICLEAAAGDVAPVAGSYIAKMSQQAVEVAAGSVAPQAGSFCVPKQDVLLMQRTYGLNTARDFEAALGKKKDQQTTTTTTTDFANANFHENPEKKVMVQQCPAEKAALLQGLDASVARKGGDDSALQDDERRVCECRSFLKSSAAKIDPQMMQQLLGLEAPTTQLLQRNLDAALASKKQETTTTTSTTTTLASSINSTMINDRMTIGCTAASQLEIANQSSWAVVAKLLNNPEIASTVFNEANITEGWQHCDQSWVVQGACGNNIMVTPEVVGLVQASTGARDFEAALSKKKDQQTTTTTTTDFANANFDANPEKEVMVQQCPAEKAALLQGLDATVARKGGDAALQDDERRVCECRSFLKSSAAKIDLMPLDEILKIVNIAAPSNAAVPAPQLLQRNLDAALASKKQETTTTTSTTTTSIFASTNLTTIDERMKLGCTTASELALGDYGMGWAVAAKLLNDPVVASQVFKKANITEGWQHCDQSWVVHGACGKFIDTSDTVG